MLKKSTKLLFLFFFISVGFSQNTTYKFKHLSTSDGLSQSSIIAIHQDKLGQLWIGTRDGLNKYDGHKFTVYRSSANDSSSIGNNDILSIIEDNEGFLWIGTYKGLNKYNPKNNTFIKYYHNEKLNSLSNNEVWTIKEIDNEIWLGTSNGISIFDKTKQTFTNIFHNNLKENSLAGNQIKTIYRDKNKRIWIGTTNGLSLLKDRNKDNFTFKNFKTIPNLKIQSLKVQDLLEHKNGEILVASANNGLLELTDENTQLKPYLKKNSYINSNVRKLLYDNDSLLWVGTYEGLYIIDKNKNVRLLNHNNNIQKGFIKNSVKSLFKDKKGSIWFGLYYGGLHFWDETNTNFINYNKENCLSYNVVSSIESINKNSLYIGTEGGGVIVRDSKNGSYININTKNYKELSNNNIKSLFLSDKNKLWIGTFEKGLNLFDVKKKQFINPKIPDILKQYLADKSVYTITKDNNNRLWIGTLNNGVICYNFLDKTHIIYKNSLKNINTISSNLIRKIMVDSKNNVWVTTQRGLNKIENYSKVTRYFYNNEIRSGDDVLTVFEDSKNNIWAGTKARGLYKLNASRFKKINLKYKEKEITAIHSILEGDYNKLWISTNKGIVKFNSNNKTISIYNQKDGIIDNEFNDNASLKTKDGIFYFGSPSGITLFKEKSLTKNTYSPQAIITDFSIKNQSVYLKENQKILEKTIPFTNKIELAHTDGNFTIQFAIPNFINPENNSYQYRLKGLEKDWVFTSENSATYTIQNPGKYIFELKGANNNKVWNTKSTELEINVSPAPWRSWWAFLLYSLAIMVALYFLINVQKSKTKLKLELGLEQLENEKIEETNKAKLQFFTNISHEFRTPLTLIIGPLKQVLADFKGSSAIYKKLLVIENNANQLLLLINRLMDFRKFENNLFKMEAAEGNIVKFLREIYLSFSEHAKTGDYKYTFNTSEETILVYYDRYKLERVFYNLISNAFRYTPKGGNINLVIKKENEFISINIEDSGVGISKENKDKIFDRFFEVALNNNPGNTYIKGTGIGLSIAKNIVKLHKGEIEVNDNKNSIGTIFKVKLPLGKNHLSESEIIKDFKFSDDVSQYVKQLNEPVVILEDQLADAIKNSEQETILIVEDNKPLRKFIKQLLKDNYNILEAENGEIGLKKAIKHTPNLIISDVIMPVMVGTELCAEIKKNIKTSHIPIILLTSRTSLIYKLDGLESGADDYISKPFDINEFKLRIHNILATQQKLREKFTGELKPNSNNVVSSIDEKLFKKALEIVNDNIANEDFNIPFFCSELGVSRTMLFVKIKAWTNYTPNDFILHLRMKRAAELLEKVQINISEVSYKVGYKNPKYFSKSFQKKFGETPSNYQKKFSEH